MHSTYPAWTIFSTAIYCAAPGCRHTPGPETMTALAEAGAADIVVPRAAVEGTDLCRFHQSRMPLILTDLSMLLADLEAGVYRRPTGEQNERVKTSGINDISSSWNVDVTEVLSDLIEWTHMIVRTVLNSYVFPPVFSIVSDRAEFVPEDADAGTASYVRTWTDIKATVHKHSLTLATPPRLALSVLARHYSRWLASYPTLGPDILADAQEHRYAAVQALKTTSVRRVGLAGAVCGHSDDDAELGPVSCMATMVGILSDDDRPSVVVCSVRPKTHRRFTKDEWMSWIA